MGVRKLLEIYACFCQNYTLFSRIKESSFRALLAIVPIFFSFNMEGRIYPADAKMNFEITGTITNEEGEPLIGVNILVKDTEGIGTTSDIDGTYILSVPDDSEALIFTYIGYKRQEVNIEGQTQIDVVMQTDNAVLDEVVVVGFGTQKKSAMVGSMTTVNPSELKIPSSNLTTAL